MKIIKIISIIVIVIGLGLAISAQANWITNVFFGDDPQLGRTIIKVPAGGTGAGTFTSGECLVGAGTGAITTSACGAGGGGEAAWEYDATNFGMTPTTTGSGIYLTGSVTTTANLYVTGDTTLASATTSETLYLTDYDCSGDANAGALTVEADGRVICSNDDSAGATAWDDIGNPDADDELDFGNYAIELNVVDFKIGDGGSNFVDFDGAGNASTTGNFIVGGNATSTGWLYVGQDLTVNGSINGTVVGDLTCTDCLNATEIEDIYLLDGASDTMTGTLTADGFTLGSTELLTIGSNTLTHDGTDFVFNDDIVTLFGIDINSATTTDSLYVGGILDVTGVITIPDPADCAAGSYARGIGVNAEATNCTDATTEINSVVNGLGGTNLTCAAQSCDVDDSFLVNSADDTTAFGLTIGSATTTDSMYVGGILDVTGALTFANDTILDAMIDWGNLTDLAAGGEVTWGNLAEGELTDSSIVSADIKNNVILEIDLSVDEEPTDNDILTFDTTGDNFSWQTPAELSLLYSGGTLTDTQLCVADGATGGVDCNIAQTYYVQDGCTDCLNDTEIDDIYLHDGASDTMTGTLTADGLTLGANENITLGGQTLDHDGTDFVFNDDIKTLFGIDINSATTTDSLYVGGFLSLANDTILDAYIDWGNLTDLAAGGEVTWGNVGAGELGNDSVINEDIDDDGAFTFTGAWDFGGGTLEIPQDGTVDATGELQLNTGSSSLEIYDGSAVAVIPSTQSFSFTIASTTFRNFAKIPIKAYRKSITITDIACRVDTATDQDIFISNGTDDTETIVCTVNNSEDDGSIANGSFDAREMMYIEMGTAAGTPDWLNVTIDFIIDP